MPSPRGSDSLRIAKEQDRFPRPCTRSVRILQGFRPPDAQPDLDRPAGPELEAQ